MLISVKNLPEARIAVHCEGVSIIDVKDPLQGSLGFAEASTINQIATLVHEENLKPEVRQEHQRGKRRKISERGARRDRRA